MIDFSINFFTGINVVLSILLLTLWLVIGILASFNVLRRLWAGKQAFKRGSAQHPYIMTGDEVGSRPEGKHGTG